MKVKVDPHSNMVREENRNRDVMFLLVGGLILGVLLGDNSGLFVGLVLGSLAAVAR